MNTRALVSWLIKTIAVIGTFEYGLHYDETLLANPILNVVTSICIWITIWGLLNLAESL